MDLGVTRGEVVLSEYQESWVKEFDKVKDNQFQVHTHFIHLVDKNGAKWNELIKFRDYLRKNEDAKLEYMTLKKSLSRLYAEDRAKYTDSKEVFVKSIINKR
ncbi:GrpB family protein [Macrococcoides canis]|uniref:GrpB family protein n=1 Tax=Macrococcoides canis TaxID=1855823 RepID=UPI00165D7B1C|nr:GrpB family protein [Macrococcus canis]